MSSDASFTAQLAARGRRLRPCRTRVTRVDGFCYVEPRTHHCADAGDGPGSLGAPTPNVADDVTDVKAGEDLPSSCSVASSNVYVNNGGVRDESALKFNSACPGFVIDYKPDLTCSLVKPYLALCGQDVAQDEGLLDEFKITHILSLLPSEAGLKQYKTLNSEGTPVLVTQNDIKVSDHIDLENSQLGDSITNTTENKRERVYVPMLDIPEFDIRAALLSCVRYISLVSRRGGVTLVHCNAGVSRAPAVVTAYLMKECGLGYLAAKEHVEKCRSHVRPNDGFVEQLREFEQLCKVSA